MAARIGSVVIGVLAGSLAGCSGYSPQSNFTLPSLPVFGPVAKDVGGDRKSTVLMSANIAGLTCAEARIVLARAEGPGFATTGVYAVESLFGSGANGAVIDLDPGTYHVVQVSCRNGGKVVYAGANPAKNAVPWQSDHWNQSLASFGLGAGEVLDVGELTLTLATVAGFSAGIDGRKAELSVHASSQRAVAEFARLHPDQAPRLRTTPLTLVASASSTIAKCRLVAPRRALPQDGTSKVPEILASTPEAKPVIESITGGIKDADGCVPDGAAAPAQASAQAE